CRDRRAERSYWRIWARSPRLLICKRSIKEETTKRTTTHKLCAFCASCGFFPFSSNDASRRTEDQRRLTATAAADISMVLSAGRGSRHDCSLRRSCMDLPDVERNRGGGHQMADLLGVLHHELRLLDRHQPCGHAHLRHTPSRERDVAAAGDAMR